MKMKSSKRHITQLPLLQRTLIPVAILSIGMFPSLSHSFECRVRVTSVLVYGDGTVNVSHTGRGDYTHICNLDQPRQGVSTTTCAMWAAMLQQVKRTNSTVDFYYGGAGSCETLPTYGGSPGPTYIGMVN
jgi:hypothetical protein